MIGTEAIGTETFALVGEAFIIGLFATPHCAAMCGPFALAASAKRPEDDRKHLWIGRNALYSLGRMTTYAVLAGLAGAFSAVVHTSAYVGWALSVVAITLAAAHIIGWFNPSRWLPAPSSSLVSRALRQKRGGAYFVGLTTALLPCGMVWAAIGLAIATGSVVGGLAVAVAFGLGTSPGLAALAALGGGLSLEGASSRAILAATVFFTGVGMASVRLFSSIS